jgi:hypothetical protein
MADRATCRPVNSEICDRIGVCSESEIESAIVPGSETFRFPKYRCANPYPQKERGLNYHRG